MLFLLTIFFLLWLARTAKNVLFWVYLWQLKEYHIKRFIDHFRTTKGRETLLSCFNIAKLCLLALYYFNIIIAFALVPLVYAVESLKFIKDLRKKRVLKPVFTVKTIALLSFSLFLEIAIVFLVFGQIDKTIWLSVLLFPLALLITDIFTPLIVSSVVLIFQPMAWIQRKKMLAKAGEKINQFKNLTVIGIAGSYGKTSTKEFLYEILSFKFRVLKTKKNINAEIGIAKTILDELKPEYQILIAEIGAYERGKIKEVCGIIKPKIGILTGINEQHMATFGSQENIIKAKHEITDCSKISFEKDKIDLKAENIIVEKECLLFDIQGINFKVNVLGAHNIENILLATKVAQELGMTLEEISKACLKIKPEQGGMKIIRREKPLIIDSSYSANSTGVIADLDYLKIYEGKKAVVMPCLIELGKSSKEVHQRIGKKLAEVCDRAIITTKECFGIILKECDKAVYIENPGEIIKNIKEFDVILLEGRVPKDVVKIWE